MHETVNLAALRLRGFESLPAHSGHLSSAGQSNCFVNSRSAVRIREVAQRHLEETRAKPIEVLSLYI